MNLLKEEKKLIENRRKAEENFKRKQKYCHSSEISLRKAEREFKDAGRKLSATRKQMKAQGVKYPIDIPEVPAVPEAIVETEPVEENTD